jgi:hypothetical protein
MSSGKPPSGEKFDVGREGDEVGRDGTQDDPPALDSPVLDSKVQAELGHQLSLYYSSLVNQPIPDVFISLLAKLDKREIAD